MELPNLSRNLRTLREGKHWTQKELARHIHISEQAYSHYETGRHTPPLEILVRLGQCYGLPLDTLVFGEKEAA